MDRIVTTPTAVAGATDDADAKRKAFSRLRALGALSGIELYELAGGGYLLTRWNMHRELPDLRAVRDLLQRMGIAA